jgi:hypothetical protein
VPEYAFHVLAALRVSKPRRPQRGRIEPTQLSQLLERIYNQRSATLHRGEPFPPNIFGLPMIGAELDFGDLMIGDRKWEEKDFIPHPSFFERLVNHVLKNFLLHNQLSTGASETR